MGGFTGSFGALFIFFPVTQCQGDLGGPFLTNGTLETHATSFMEPDSGAIVNIDLVSHRNAQQPQTQTRSQS